MKTKIIPAILILGILLTAVSAIMLYNKQPSIFSSNTASKHKIVCEATLGNPIGIPLIRNGDINIESYYCYSDEDCGMFSAFNIISDSGNLELRMDDGARQSKSYSINEGSSETYKISVCSAKLTGRLTTIDAESKVTDSKAVNI